MYLYFPDTPRMLLIFNVWETDHVFQKKSIVDVLCACNNSSEHKYINILDPAK